MNQTTPAVPLGQLVTTDPARAVPLLRDALVHKGQDPRILRLLGQALRNLGRGSEAELAENAAIRASVRDPELIGIAQFLLANDLPAAETALRQRLSVQPRDVAAIRMMAELAGRIGRYRDAEALLQRALELAPGFAAARANLATVLYKQNRFADAVAALDTVLAADAASAGDLNLRAAALGRIGEYEESRRIYRELLDSFPDHAKLWMSYGHILKTLGEQVEAVTAYRRCIAIEPALGEAWWSLANLKTVRFEDADVAAMQSALDTSGIAQEDRLHLHFALAKALEQHGDAQAAFTHYAQGNALRSMELQHDPDAVTEQVDAVIETFTPAYLSAHSGGGAPSMAPIFILGMPRAGSTLIEQILASHSQVEGTMELPDIPALAMREAQATGGRPRDWPAALAAMSAAKRTELGAEFLERTRVQRKTDKPYYIDKLPNNWAYLGFIAQILPNAKIIDARRDPLDCCVSNFRQNYAKGQAFSYDLAHMGRYYADYVRALRHYDDVMPGRVHRVIHEHLLDDPEREVRAMLDYLGLPFEQACLEFHTNTRAVRTASSEQVRRPINRDGVGQWLIFAQWLSPLRAALGDLPETYADF